METPVQVTDGKCLVCKKELSFRWSDTHGIAVCTTCGMPYRVYHYENEKRVEKPPESGLKQSGIDLAKRYWEAKKQRVFPACFDLGISHYEKCSYSGATVEDVQQWIEWVRVNDKPTNN